MKYPIVEVSIPMAALLHFKEVDPIFSMLAISLKNDKFISLSILSELCSMQKSQIKYKFDVYVKNGLMKLSMTDNKKKVYTINESCLVKCLEHAWYTSSIYSYLPSTIHCGQIFNSPKKKLQSSDFTRDMFGAFNSPIATKWLPSSTTVHVQTKVDKGVITTTVHYKILLVLFSMFYKTHRNRNYSTNYTSQSVVSNKFTFTISDVVKHLNNNASNFYVGQVVSTLEIFTNILFKHKGAADNQDFDMRFMPFTLGFPRVYQLINHFSLEGKASAKTKVTVTLPSYFLSYFDHMMDLSEQLFIDGTPILADFPTDTIFNLHDDMFKLHVFMAHLRIIKAEGFVRPSWVLRYILPESQISKIDSISYLTNLLKQCSNVMSAGSNIKADIQGNHVEIDGPGVYIKQIRDL